MVGGNLVISVQVQGNSHTKVSPVLQLLTSDDNIGPLPLPAFLEVKTSDCITVEL